MLCTLSWPVRSSDVIAVVPAYNEEGSVGQVVKTIRNYGFSDVLVVDDGSMDRTASVAQEAGAYVIKLPYNLGIGGAVQAGLRYAYERGYAYVIRLDADGQHGIEDTAHLLDLVRQDQADVAIGSRFVPGHRNYSPPIFRKLGILWFAAMISLITRQPAYDTTSGMQALNRRALFVLAKNYPQDYPEVEARILLHKARLRVIEAPVSMQPRTAGTSSITLVRAIYYMIKVSIATILAVLQKLPSVYTGEINIHAGGDANAA